MQWIKQYTEGSFKIYSGNMINAFQPIDFFHFYPMWHDLWLPKIYEVIQKLNLQNKAYAEIRTLLPVPSSMRAILQKLIPSYQHSKNQDQKVWKEVIDFFARMLIEACPKDPFALTSNPLHTEREVKELIQNLEWEKGDVEVGRMIGQLITAAGSLVHGQLNDLVTDLGWDAYGPYTLENDQTLLIRHFPHLQPVELWNEEFCASIQDLKIYGIYKNVEWEIAYVGCHTIAKQGSPVHDLQQFAIIADGKILYKEEIKKLIRELSQKAEAIYRKIRSMDFESLKTLVMKQECYQLKTLFDAAKVNWLPTKEMLERVNNKPLMPNIIPHGILMEKIEDYKRIFGIRKFTEEVLGEEI